MLVRKDATSTMAFTEEVFLKLHLICILVGC